MNEAHNNGITVHPQAPLQLDVLVIGGGIAGLGCAYALRRSGHRVTVLEQWRDGSSRLSGGIRVPPNLTKILVGWGLGEDLAKSVRCRKSPSLSMETGKLQGIVEWQEEVIRETGGEFILMHHQDLHSMLFQLATSAGVNVTYDAQVSDVSADEHGAYVHLANGDRLEADLCIGADGTSSLVRQAIMGMQDEKVPSGMNFFTMTVPIEEMRADPDLKQWADVAEWPMWTGTNRAVHGYPLGDRGYAVQVFWPDYALDEESDEGWDIVVPSSALKMDSFAPEVKKLVHMAPNALRTRWFKRDPIEDWADQTGRLVLAGDAAHPLMPCCIHGPSMAIEDAAVLGGLFERISSLKQIAKLTYAYQDLREERTVMVDQSEQSNAAIVSLPPGPAQDQRNAMLALTLLQQEHGEWDESQLREQLDHIGGIFGYSAVEAAQEWWTKWGALQQHSDESSAGGGGDASNRMSRPFFDFMSIQVAHTNESNVDQSLEVAG